jgi:hypothetical protein
MRSLGLAIQSSDPRKDAERIQINRDLYKRWIGGDADAGTELLFRTGDYGSVVVGGVLVSGCASKVGRDNARKLYDDGMLLAPVI